MKILISTAPDDNHALLVKLALESVGHSVRLLFSADHPTQQTNTVFIDEHSYEWLSRDNYDAVQDNTYDVVWWRRARKPYIPRDKLHPADYSFVQRENQCFMESLMANLAPHAWWINSKFEATRAHSKLFQLKTAQLCDLTIPVTLCSNDATAVRAFVRMHEAAGVIYKSLYSGLWFEDKGMKIAYTSKISESELPEKELLQLTPGLYQKEIKKAFELRVVCFGDYMIAAKLDSQAHVEGQMDWRAIPGAAMQIEPYELPQALAQKLRTFMRAMGLVFGSLDLIITPTGEAVFLEVNEQGQFLWLDDYHDDLNVLDTFIQFIEARTINFYPQEGKYRHSIATYTPFLDVLMTENLTRHVDVNHTTMYRSYQ